MKMTRQTGGLWGVGEEKIIVGESGRERQPSKRARISRKTFARTEEIEHCESPWRRVPILITKLVWCHGNEVVMRKDAPEKNNHYLASTGDPVFPHQWID